MEYKRRGDCCVGVLSQRITACNAARCLIKDACARACGNTRQRSDEASILDSCDLLYARSHHLHCRATMPTKTRQATLFAGSFSHRVRTMHRRALELAAANAPPMRGKGRACGLTARSNHLPPGPERHQHMHSPASCTGAIAQRAHCGSFGTGPSVPV